MTRCVACDKQIDEMASDTELCYVCLATIRDPFQTSYSDKHGPVKILTREEILELYEDGIYESKS